MITDAAVLARLIEADPALGPVVAEARALGMDDDETVGLFATTLADVLRRVYGSPPRSLIAHVVETERKTR